MSDVKQILEKDVETVRAYLRSYKEKTIPNLGPFTESSDQLHSLTWDYTEREWKGLRSSFVLQTAATFNGDIDLALILASLMQLEQDWILIHDDLEDRSDLRRGKPALYKMEGIGDDIAINVGDRLRTLADKLFGKALEKVASDRAFQSRLYDFRHQLLDETTQGQHFENTMRKLPLSKISLPAVLLIYDRKTGAYTYEMPCGYGLMSSKMSSEDIARLRVVFRSYGAPFQIEDDRLNLLAEPKSGYGKEFADDILEGKWTIFAERAEKLLRGRDLERHHEIYGNRNSSVVDRKEDIELFVKYGVFDQAAIIKDALLTQARNRAYDLIPRTKEGRILMSVLNFGCDRPK